MSPNNLSALPLIVGAGPVGKAAALFLARAGVATRIIDVADTPSPYSKALAVNPRTLELLEPTGVTERMLALGLQIRGVRFWRGTKLIGGVTVDDLAHRYPFMLALSQAVTERLLEDALAEQGGHVERGIGLVACRNRADGVEAELQRKNSAGLEHIKCPWLLAADGAHSATRRALNLDFSGSSFLAPWRLADVPLATSLEHDRAHVFFPDGGGFLFAIRVVQDVSQETVGNQLWRVISNLPDPVEKLPNAAPSGSPVWTSTFNIAHRLINEMQVGNVYFAGDTAHVHSPVGARGMNLGIEDAWVFSELLKSGRMSRYAPLRRSVDYRVVKRVELFSRIVRGESVYARFLRSLAAVWLTRIPFVRRQIIQTVAGLDHALRLE
jgi:2-polyprenyl-6-methoxyphenol hydroxylase-like FAD-dependent oxidoreductase